MAQDQLRDLFREKKQKTKPADADWAAKREAWKKAVEKLYQTIADYLRAAEAEVELVRVDKNVVEDSVGEYWIRDLVLRVGEEQVIFSPKGINVVGAKGRVDVHGDRGEAAIIWQEADRWSIVAARTPVLRLVPLTADSLAEMLRGVMRP